MKTMTRVLASKGQLRALALDDVRPDDVNMSNGSYQLMRDVFFVAHPNVSQDVTDFLDFVEGPGTAVVIKEQAIPLDR